MKQYVPNHKLVVLLALNYNNALLFREFIASFHLFAMSLITSGIEPNEQLMLKLYSKDYRFIIIKVNEKESFITDEQQKKSDWKSDISLLRNIKNEVCFVWFHKDVQKSCLVQYVPTNAPVKGNLSRNFKVRQHS